MFIACGIHASQNLKKSGKREGAGRKKSTALAKITRETNQKHWRANQHCTYLESLRFLDLVEKSVGREPSIENDSNFASWQSEMRLTSLHDFYGPWHLYICRSLFRHSTFFVASLVVIKGT